MSGDEAGIRRLVFIGTRPRLCETGYTQIDKRASADHNATIAASTCVKMKKKGMDLNLGRAAADLDSRFENI